MPERETLVTRIRAACADLPEVTERPSHGAPTFFVRGKKSFVSLWAEGHHKDDFPHLCCAAADGVQGELIDAEPRTFFRPPYVGHLGWIGVRLDTGIGDDELAELCQDAYRVVAPATLVKQLDEGLDGRG